VKDSKLKRKLGILGKKKIKTPKRKIYSTPSHAIQRLSTSASLIEYFGDDEADKINKKKIKDKYFYHSASVNFSLKQYCEFFIIHYLAYSLLGPFINVYNLFCYKNKYLMWNLMFLRCLPSFFIQHGFWVLNMLQIFLHFYGSTGNPSDYGTILITLLQQLLRASSIAGKYATFPKNLIKKIKETSLSFGEIMRELMLVGWMSQRSSVLEQEIVYSMRRLEIDNTMLKIAFLSSLPRSTREKLENIEKVHTKGCYEHVTLRGKELIELKY